MRYTLRVRVESDVFVPIEYDGPLNPKDFDDGIDLDDDKLELFEDVNYALEEQIPTWDTWEVLQVLKPTEGEVTEE